MTFVHYFVRAKKVLAVLPVLAFSACAFQPAPLANPAQYKTVAVVSLLPETYSMTYTGFTIFGNRAAVFPLDYDPNQIAINDATKLLSQTFEIRNLDLNRVAIMAGVQQNYSSIDLANTAPLVQAQLEKLVKPGSVDLIIVIDGTMPDPVGRLGPTNSGSGLYSSWQITGGPVVCKSYGTAPSQGASCSSGVIAPFEVFDGRSFQQIALSYAGQMSGPEDDLNWKGESYDQLSAADKVTLDEIGKQALGIYVAASLSDVHLTN